MQVNMYLSQGMTKGNIKYRYVTFFSNDISDFQSLFPFLKERKKGRKNKKINKTKQRNKRNQAASLLIKENIFFLLFAPEADGVHSTGFRVIILCLYYFIVLTRNLNESLLLCSAQSVLTAHATPR